MTRRREARALSRVLAAYALVVYERDGAPLADDEGKIALVSLKDARPGPRHVKWLQAIELRAGRLATADVLPLRRRDGLKPCRARIS